MFFSPRQEEEEPVDDVPEDVEGKGADEGVRQVAGGATTVHISRGVVGISIGADEIGAVGVYHHAGGVSARCATHVQTQPVECL